MLHIFDKEGKWQQQGSYWIPSFLWQKEQMYDEKDFDVEGRKSKPCCHTDPASFLSLSRWWRRRCPNWNRMACENNQRMSKGRKDGFSLLWSQLKYYFLEVGIISSNTESDRKTFSAFPFLRMIERRKRRKTVERKWKDRTLFSFVDPDPGQVILDVSGKQMKKREEEREGQQIQREDRIETLSLSSTWKIPPRPLDVSLISVCLLFSLLNQLHCQQQQPKNKEGASVQRKPLQDPDTSSPVPSLLFFDLLIQHKLTIVFPSQLFLHDFKASCIDCWTSCHIPVSVYMFTSFDISMQGI